MAIFEFGADHVDRSLSVVWYQHGDKIVVDVSTWIDGHFQEHFAYGPVAIDKEFLLLTVGGHRPDVACNCLILSSSDRKR
jgi:hypothetical protein